MAETIRLRVLTDAGVAVEDEAISIVAPGELGYLGILKNHAPLVTTLGRGRLTWRRPDGTSQQLDVGVGFLEIIRNRCTILTDAIS